MPISWVTCPSCSSEDMPSKNGTIICLNEECPSNLYESAYGKRFAITGTFLPGQYAIKRLIEDAGGEVKQSVSRQVDYLVKGVNYTRYTSNKERAASRLGIPIIDENELREMVNS